MLTDKSTGWKLFRVALLLSVFAVIIGICSGLVLQERLANFSQQSQIMDGWLKGTILTQGDPELKAIWDKLAEIMAERAKSFDDKGGPLPLNLSTPPAPSISFPNVPGKGRVYVDFDHGSYYQFDEQFKDPDGNAPAQYLKDLDKIGYKKFLYGFYQPVRIPDKHITDTTEATEAIQRYSDRLLDFFKLKAIVSKKIRNLTVSSVYAASSNGTMAIYPWNSIDLSKDPDFILKKRGWYAAATGDANRTEFLPPPGKENDKTFGLAHFYVDAVSGDYIRTFWHKVDSPVNDKLTITYILCIDLNLGAPQPQQVLLPLPVIPQFEGVGGWKEPLGYGLLSGLAVLILGSAMILLSSVLFPHILRGFIVKRQPDEWETEDYFTSVSRALAPRERITMSKGRKDEQGNEKKLSFAAWFPMQMVKLSYDRSNNTKDVKYTETKTDVTLGSIHDDPFTRGSEVWQVFRSKWRSEGACRLCGQDVQFKEADIPIADPTIRHRRSQYPSIDPRINPRSDVKDTKSLEQSLIWHATDIEPKETGKLYKLTPPPIPRIPGLIQNLSLFKEYLEGYRMLSQSRIDLNDCVEMSKELFKERNIRAVCHIDYFNKIATGGDKSVDALAQGNNIERVLVADNVGSMIKFINEHQIILHKLLNRRNQELFKLYLDEIGVEFEPHGKQRFDLDFAIVYDETPSVIVSNLNEINREGKVRGYLSWRKVDVVFFETLFERFTDFRSPLKPEDLPSITDDKA